MTVTSSTLSEYRRGALVQVRVIGALIVRELQTRFGRENIGYLWFIVEPALLAIGITVAHIAAHVSLEGGLEVAPFYISGYVAYMMFRSNVTRATSTIEPNRGLLYHRQVTLFDLLAARCLLEAAATLTTMLLLLGLCAALGFGSLPPKPLILILGMGLMLWYTFGLAMLICAGSEASSTFERLVHPAVYLIIPVSGMFFLLEWLPEGVRRYVMWLPLPQIIEFIREGALRGVESKYVNLPYLAACCGAQTLVGLSALKVTRRRMHLE